MAEIKNIKVIMVEPGKKAKVTEIDHSLESLQEAVGGWIEAIYPWSDKVCLVCNEEGKFNGMEPNRAIRADGGEIYDVIFGTFLVCGCSGESFGDLTDEQAERYIKMFERPEIIVSVNGRLMVVKVDDDGGFMMREEKK